ncbi:FAD-linked oxidase C-terminal domain-containing protein [Desulfothermus naphthae]
MTFKLKKDHKRFLLSLFGEKDVLFEREKILIFGTDASKEFAWPSVVVRPSSVTQIKELLKWADKNKIPIIPRARATNVVGGCVPVYGGIVVSMLKLNRILDIDERDYVAEVQPGVVTGDLQKVLKQKSLFYPPDPASAKISTIGGNVSQNAGGLRAVKYGVTKDYVLGLDVCIPGGEMLFLGGRSHKDVVGLDLKSIMIGSEGTLGIFTKIILKILPLPDKYISILVGFNSLERLIEVAAKILKTGLIPVAMEFMDSDVLNCLRELGKVDISKNIDSLLLLQFDGNEKEVEWAVYNCEKLFKELDIEYYEKGGDKKREEELWEVRRLINPASHKMGEKKIALDICVPRSKVPIIINDSKSIGKKFNIPILCFGHLGDGNIHVNIMYSDDREEIAHEVAYKILQKTLERGGTISGEHGIGILKLDLINKQLSNTEINLMRKIKTIFDPNNIMNPGKAY